MVAESEGNRERVAEEEADAECELAQRSAAVAGSCLLVLFFYACEALWKTAFQQHHRLAHGSGASKCLGGSFPQGTT